MPFPLCSDLVKEIISLIGIMFVALGVTHLTRCFGSVVSQMTIFSSLGHRTAGGPRPGEDDVFLIGVLVVVLVSLTITRPPAAQTRMPLC